MRCAFAGCWLLFDVRCLLFVVRSLLSGGICFLMCRLLFPVFCLSIIGLFVGCWLLRVVRSLLFADCCSLFGVACRLLFVG